MSTLYELTNDYMMLLDMAEDPDIDPQAFADTLAGLDGEIEIKAEGYAKAIRILEGDIAARKAEAKRLSGGATVMENNVRRMKQALLLAMQVTGKTKFKTPLFSFGIRKNPPSVVIDHESDIPNRYLIPQDPTIDKKSIKEMLKENPDCTWAHLEQSESLSIR